MSLSFVITLFVLGVIGALLAGMLGMGGAIIHYPLLLYVPVMLGFSSFDAYEVSGIVAVQVFFTSLSGMLTYRKGGFLNKQLVVTMGSSVLIGSLLGSYGSGYLQEDTVNFVYGILALIAAVLMFVPKKGREVEPGEQVGFNKWLAAILALVVGVSAGIVGAGGAFLLVPIMLVVLKIPTRMTIATSLSVAFISSSGSTSGKIATDQVLLWPAAVMIVASLIGSPIGAKIGQKVNTKFLQGLLAVLIVITTINIWYDILH